jgi:hypothetical protein
MRELPAAAVGVLAGIVASAALYGVVVGILSALFGGPDTAASLPFRAGLFGVTFGLISGGHLGMAAARRTSGGERPSMPVKLALVGVVLLALVLVFTGDRWNTIIDGAGGGPMLVLVVAWIAFTHILERMIDHKGQRLAH